MVIVYTSEEGSVVYTSNLQSLLQPYYTKERNSKYTLQK